MNKKLLAGIRNFNYMLSSNLITFFVSAIIVIFVPKYFGIEEYGYIQLYLFYSSYAGFLLFGWNDGVYLRFGGHDYQELDKSILNIQFYMSLILQLVVFVILIFANQLLVSPQIIKIFYFVVLSILITNSSGILLSILQATNRFKEFSTSQLTGRFAYIVFAMFFIFSGFNSFKVIIISDLIGKLLTLLLGIYFCKDVVIGNLSNFYFDTKEAYKNISVGSKLMFANIASMLIIGIVRFGIERTWSVETFGKVSLTLSISNMMMIFINAVGIIMFPILRRTNQEKLANIYSTMRDFLMVILLGFLIIYYPLKTVMAAWLPQYAESLLYMSLVFPMFIYEGKMALLINTYLKTLRREKVMLKINLISMFMSLVMTYFTTQIFVNLDIAILSIVILLAIRSVLAENYLAKELNIKVKKDILLEVSLTLVFILTGWFVNSWMTAVVYGISYLFYLIIKKKDIIITIHNIKSLIKA